MLTLINAFTMQVIVLGMVWWVAGRVGWGVGNKLTQSLGYLTQNVEETLGDPSGLYDMSSWRIRPSRGPNLQHSSNRPWLSTHRAAP